VRRSTAATVVFSESMNDIGENERIGQNVASVATQISLITNKALTDATGDVTAIGSAFELNADNLQSVVDAVASSKTRSSPTASAPCR
jgi:hypothetical protein